MTTVTIDRLVRVSDGVFDAFPILEFRSSELFEASRNAKLLLVPSHSGRSYALRILSVSYPASADAAARYQVRVYPWNDLKGYMSPVEGLLDRWFAKRTDRTAEVTHAGRWARDLP